MALRAFIFSICRSAICIARNFLAARCAIQTSDYFSKMRASPLRAQKIGSNCPCVQRQPFAA
jgi:hypothetical protein